MRRTALVLLSLFLASCAAEPLAPRPELHLSLERVERSQGDGAEAELRLEQRGGRAVALAGCPRAPYARVERLAGSAWEEVLSHGLICQAIYATETIAFGPGSSLTFRVGLLGPGTYRVRVLAGVDPEYPEAVVVSAAFAVQ